MRLASLATWWRKRQAQKSERSRHRATAANCRYFIGDNYFADWGDCPHCPKEMHSGK